MHFGLVSFAQIGLFIFCDLSAHVDRQAAWHFSGKRATRRVVRKMRILILFWNTMIHFNCVLVGVDDLVGWNAVLL